MANQSIRSAIAVSAAFALLGVSLYIFYRGVFAGFAGSAEQDPRLIICATTLLVIMAGAVRLIWPEGAPSLGQGLALWAPLVGLLLLMLTIAQLPLQLLGFLGLVGVVVVEECLSVRYMFTRSPPRQEELDSCETTEPVAILPIEPSLHVTQFEDHGSGTEPVRAAEFAHQELSLETCSDEEFREEELPTDVDQQLTRSSGEHGDCLSGLLRCSFAQGQRRETVYVAFCPPFEKRPEVDASIRDGAEGRVTVSEVLTWGVQLDVRLDQIPEMPTSSVIEMVAIC